MDLLILGLDGASFLALDVWMGEGLLHSIRTIAASGTRAILRSVIPPYTPQAWTTLSTGLDPGRHGIAGFTTAGGHLVDARAVAVPRVWDILARDGWRAGTVNVPLTYPARPLPGFQISGMLAPNVRSAFAEPPALREALRRMHPPYAIDFVADKRDRLDPAVVDRLGAMLEARYRAIRMALQLQPVDLLFVDFVVLDRLGHLFWKYLDPAEALFRSAEGEALRRRAAPLLRRLDAIAGELASRARLGTIVVSDHGFQAERGKFYTNRFLEEAGYLALRPSPIRRLFRRALERTRPDRVRPFLPKRWIRGGLAATEGLIDRERSLAFASGIASQGIRLGPRAPAGLADEIIERLRTLEDPRGGPLVRFAARREAVYRGDRLEAFPEIVFLAGDGAYEATPALFKREAIVPAPPDDPGGCHHRDGIFIAGGRLFASGVEAEPLEMVDVLPTLLEAVGVRPEGLDGTVRREILSEEAGRRIPRDREAGSRAPPRDGPSPEDEEEVRRRLEGLGYL